MKLFKTLVTTCLAACALAFQSQAALQSQMIASGTNNIAVNATNTYILPGATTANTNGLSLAGGPNLFIDCSKSKSVFLEAGGLFANAGANSSNITFRVSQAVTGQNDWTNNAKAIVVVCPGLTTNWAWAQVPIDPAFPLYAIRTVENASIADVTGTNLVFQGAIKNGL